MVNFNHRTILFYFIFKCRLDHQWKLVWHSRQIEKLKKAFVSHHNLLQLSFTICISFDFMLSGLKAGQPQLSKSKTSSELHSHTQDDSALNAPKPMARFRSVENIASTDKDTDAFVPIPAPRKGSITEKDGENVSRPLPTPRRNVQSCVIDSEVQPREAPPTAPRPQSSIIDNEPLSRPQPRGPPPTAPRPQSTIMDRQLPPVPKAPEISENHYAAIQTMDIKKAEDAKNSLAKMTENDKTAQPVRGPPPVPKRTDPPAGVAGASSLLDEPISPLKDSTAPDPFDTSRVRQLVPGNVPLLPKGPAVSGVKVESSSLPVVPPRPMDSSFPSNDDYLSPVSENFINNEDGLNDYGVIWPSESSLSPPLAPPSVPCPSGPPPPPPRTDSRDSSLSPPLGNETLQLPSGLGLAAPPPIPVRPSIPPDFDLTNEDALFNGPPVPARTAPPPPVPRRPDC